ncbi:MAG: MmgE/PrpD family protein [Dehalococcoidia bacterium]
MTQYLDQVAAFAADTRFEDIPPAAVDAAKWILLDTLGGMLASSTLPETRKFADMAARRGRDGVATLVGFADKADPLFAAMLNATSACSFETDEGNRLGGGHPAIHVLPPSLAEAEARGATGRQLIETIVVSYEVMSRLASGSPARWPIHSHGTHGSPGAAAAVAHLRGYDATDMRRVLNLATCMSPATTWQVCFEGGTVRNIFPAESCFLGMMAVDLDACGYTSAADAPPNVFGEIMGDGTYDTERVVRDLGSQWRVTTNYFKLHASCAITHPPLDATYNILDRRPVAPDEIASIEVIASPVSGYLAYDDPENMLSAKFSIPYSIAAAVVLRRTDIDAFRGPSLDDPRIRDLARRVTVTPDPDVTWRDHKGRNTAVMMKLRSGETLSSETEFVRGDAMNPVDRSVLLEKFRYLAGQRLNESAVQAVIDAVMAIEGAADLSRLRASVAPAG